MTENTTPA